MDRDNTIAARRFCLIFTSLTAAAFLFTATANWIVDPYAQYGTGWFAPLVQTSRAEKLALLKTFQEPPTGLVLGSSRVLKLEPDYLARKFGGTFFNCGVNHGRPEDFLAYLRFFHQRFGRYPETIVLGLDITAFVEQPGIDARLLCQTELVQQIPEAVTWENRAQRWKELLSWQQTKMSVKSLRHAMSGSVDADIVESFQPDGLLVYHEREREIREGIYDFQEALEYNQREYRQLFAGYQRLSSMRCRMFADLVKTCRDHEIRLIAFLTPMHPDLSQHLHQLSNFTARKHDVLAFVAHTVPPETGLFADLSDLQQFAGNPQLFVDGIHPLEPNTRLMIDELNHQLNYRTRYVIQ